MSKAVLPVSLQSSGSPPAPLLSMPRYEFRGSWFLPGGRAGWQGGGRQSGGRQGGLRRSTAAARGDGEVVPAPVRELGVGGVAAAVDVAVGLQAVLGRTHQVGGLHRRPGRETHIRESVYGVTAPR